ncbi:hypothetical protein BASA81_000783 [Batrachochytrium salamandrivorans]|nr:hypothetical protein BASA81_000783 [Batrachochytrium salamandrivorans]
MASLFRRSLWYMMFEEDVSERGRDRLWFLAVLACPLMLIGLGFIKFFLLVSLWLIWGYGKGPVEIYLALKFSGNDTKRIVSLLNKASRYDDALTLQGDHAIISAEARHFSLQAERCLDPIEQIVLYKQALRGFTKPQLLQPECQVQKAEILNSLAGLMENKLESLVLFKQAIDLGKQAVSYSDPRVTVWIVNLGILQQELEQYNESLNTFELALKVKNELLLDAFPELVAEWKTSMAYLLFSRPEDHVPARRVLELVEGALEIRTIANDQIKMAQSLNDCALLTILLSSQLIDSEDELLPLMERAQDRGRRCAELYLQTLGPDHPSTIKAKSDWGLR